MRGLTDPALQRYRLRSPAALAYLDGRPEERAGVFLLPSGLRVIASRDKGWDHVSVSRPDRCPTWGEMCHVHGVFFRGDEWAMQLHPPAAHNVSYHDYTLHLWRPTGPGIPTPPKWLVGPYQGWEEDLEAAGLEVPSLG